MTTTALEFLNVLLLPIVWLLLDLRTELAALRATQTAHAERLTRLETAK